VTTGAVDAFAPNQATIGFSSITTSQNAKINPCDTVLFVNAGTVLVFVTVGVGNGTTASATNGIPIAGGARVLLSASPSAVGPSPDSVYVAVYAASTAGPVYAIGGLGTQY
jgi:phage tail sheath protein FI